LLTIQISELKILFNQSKASNPLTPASAPSGAGSNKYEQWHLVKEFNMIVKDGKTQYWCNQHKYHLSGIQGMYVFHKPTIMRHGWLARHPLMHDVEKETKRKLQLLLLLPSHL
jgi:hypothetical protein